MLLIEYLDERFKSYKDSGLFAISPSVISGSKEDCSLLAYHSEDMREILGNVYEKLYELEYNIFGLWKIGTLCDAYRYHSYFIDPDGDIYRCDRLIGKKLENTNLERCRDELCIIDKIIEIVYIYS